MTKTQYRWRTRRLLVAIAALVIAVSVGGLAYAATTRSAATANGTRQQLLASNSVPGTVTALSTVSANYDPIESLVGDPTTSGGVWFLDEDTDADTIFHALPDGAMESWPLLTGSSYLPPQGPAVVAVTSAGYVWVGFNDELLGFDSSSGNVLSWEVPVGQDNLAAESFRPQNLQGVHSVVALAVAPDGDVAVALTCTSNVEIFNPASGQFSSVSLPTNSDQPLALAYSTTDTLAVGVSDIGNGGHADTLLLKAQGGGTALVSFSKAGSAWSLAPYGGSSFIVGSTGPEIVTSEGTVTAVAVPSDLIDDGSSPSALLVLPDGVLAGISQTGLVEFPSNEISSSDATTAAVDVSLPTPANLSSCGSPSELVVSSTVAVTPGPCGGGTFESVAMDGQGNIWVVVPGGSAHQVGILSFSQGQVSNELAARSKS